MKIQVTQEDINKGERKNCFKCPIALAILKVVSSYDFFPDIAVTRRSIKFNNERASVQLPPEATWFIDQYDSCYPVSPFEFELDINL